MILLKILDHDLHRSKRGPAAVPFKVETPAKPDFFPAIVSSTRGKFLIAKKMTPPCYLSSGVFDYDHTKLDDLIPDMMSVALALSKEMKWPNIFPIADAKRAFGYIRKESGAESQPHVLLVPLDYDDDRVRKWLGSKNTSDDSKFQYLKTARILKSKVISPVFLSRPDMVGMYTQFMGGPLSIVLSNIRRGLAFLSD